MDREAAREREIKFLSYEGDAVAVYRFDAGEMADHFVPLERARLDGESPIISGYNLISTGPIMQGVDTPAILDEYRANSFVRPGDVVAFKQAGTVTCWYVDQLAYSKMPGLLENAVNEALKPSVMESLRQCRKEAGKSHDGAASSSPCRNPER